MNSTPGRQGENSPMAGSICIDNSKCNRKSNKDSNSLTILSLLLLVLLWFVAAALTGKEIILPGPAATFRALKNLLTGTVFWRSLSATLLRGFAGFGLSYLAGLVLGLFSGLSRPFSVIFRPLLVTMRSTPSISLILLALIWFRADLVAVFVTFLVVFPLVTQNVMDGIRNIDPQLVEMARIYQVKPWRIFRELYLPAITPYLATAAASGLGLTWKVTVTAEVMAAPALGIGVRMDTARIFLQTPEVFAWTLVVVLLGLVFDRVLENLVEKGIVWR